MEKTNSRIDACLLPVLLSVLEFIGNGRKRPDGCRQSLKPLEENLKDDVYRLLPISSFISGIIITPEYLSGRKIW